MRIINKDDCKSSNNSNNIKDFFFKLQEYVFFSCENNTIIFEKNNEKCALQYVFRDFIL